MIKSVSTRALYVSCLLGILAAFAPGLASAEDASTSKEEPQYNQAYQDYMNSLNTANAAASYTGNNQLQQQMMQPGMVMMPVMAGMPQLPGQSEEEQQQVIMRYDKKAVEGSFYGVALPERLFNNVPSEW